MATSCGTYAGYRAHQKAKTAACEPCRDAKRRYSAERRDATRKQAIPEAPEEPTTELDDQAQVLRDNLRRLESVIPRIQASDPTRLAPLLKERRDTAAALAALDGNQEDGEDEFTRARRERSARPTGTEGPDDPGVGGRFPRR